MSTAGGSGRGVRVRVRVQVRARLLVAVGVGSIGGLGFHFRVLSEAPPEKAGGRGATPTKMQGSLQTSSHAFRSHDSAIQRRECQVP